MISIFKKYACMAWRRAADIHLAVWLWSLIPSAGAVGAGVYFHMSPAFFAVSVVGAAVAGFAVRARVVGKAARSMVDNPVGAAVQIDQSTNIRIGTLVAHSSSRPALTIDRSSNVRIGDIVHAQPETAPGGQNGRASQPGEFLVLMEQKKVSPSAIGIHFEVPVSIVGPIPPGNSIFCTASLDLVQAFIVRSDGRRVELTLTSPLHPGAVGMPITELTKDFVLILEKRGAAEFQLGWAP
jgi:hypothetical protein